MTDSLKKQSQRTIPFSPPDIGDAEIEEVCEALRSGWITTGPKTKELERRLRAFTKSAGLACVNSGTAGLETALRLLGIGEGDEVIVPAYTYSASASCVIHVGATPVMCDVAEGTYQLDIDQIPSLVTERTKAVIPVDLGGMMVDYDHLFEVLDSVSDRFYPRNDVQAHYSRVIVVADSAHALGATYKGRPAGSVADFTAFSFHAVKNFTTAEGGAVCWREAGFDNDEMYHQAMLWSLHGQDKDALAKTRPGAWEYDIKFPGYKCNMTDMQAALGLAQLTRYPGLMKRRHQLVERYQKNLAGTKFTIMPHTTDTCVGSGHLMLTRIQGATEQTRNAFIEKMGERGIATNVHYKPLPMMTAYKALHFDIKDFPHTYAQYANEVTLPLYTLLTDDDVDYVCQNAKDVLNEIFG